VPDRVVRFPPTSSTISNGSGAEGVALGWRAPETRADAHARVSLNDGDNHGRPVRDRRHVVTVDGTAPSARYPLRHLGAISDDS